MPFLKKKVSIGASNSVRNAPSNQRSRSTPNNPYTSPQDPTAEITVTPVGGGAARQMVFRDEIFEVTIRVTGTSQVYTGTMNLTLSQGETHQDLGNPSNAQRRGRVQMYDFANTLANPNCDQDRSITSLRFEESDNGEKTFRAVVNRAQVVRIRAHDPARNLTVETGDIHVVLRMRQYTTRHGNGTVNDYDGNINTWVNYWENWHLGDPAYTFIDGAIPPPELVKAVTYNESTLYPRDRITNEENLDLMHVTGVALNGMTIQPEGTRAEDLNTENDVNATGLGDPDAEGRYTGTGDNMQLMNYGTLNEGHTVQEYTVTNGPTDATVDDSFQWGIRWLISKYTRIPVINGDVVTIRALGWWGEHGALRRYGPSNDETYADDIQRLYQEGRNPNPGAPMYLWPIKADGCPRQ